MTILNVYKYIQGHCCMLLNDIILPFSWGLMDMVTIQ